MIFLLKKTQTNEASCTKIVQGAFFGCGIRKRKEISYKELFKTEFEKG